ncbi:hypothetical protein G4B88_004340 [Cannabis sativa]|uniref:RNase H type-1 domain-containing protein n=1 Tax=Cannabis sativa TaxID=3483 RepID=A0A7J6HZR7_CANSA|nr:hypothetical protein G4B88_004340 [Cannabis sativa]
MFKTALHFHTPASSFRVPQNVVHDHGFTDVADPISLSPTHNNSTLNSIPEVHVNRLRREIKTPSYLNDYHCYLATNPSAFTSQSATTNSVLKIPLDPEPVNSLIWGFHHSGILTDYKDAQKLSSTLSLLRPSSPPALHHILQEDTPAVFVDASLNHEDIATGLGLLFKKGPHQILNSPKFYKARASTPIFAEAQALYEGIQWYISSQLNPRFIFTDCLNLVTKVNGTWHDHSTLSSIIVKIRISLSNYPEASLLHLPRQFNKNAHSLAKAALRLRDEDLEEFII